MNHDAHRTAKLGVDPTHFTWLDENATPAYAVRAAPVDDPKPKTRPKATERPGKGRVVLGVIFLLYAAISIPIWAPMFKANPTMTLFIVALGLTIAAIPFRVRLIALVPLAYIGYCFLTISELTLTSLQPLLGVSTFVIAAVWGLVLPFKKVRKRKGRVRTPKKDRSVPQEDTYRFVYGSPGGVGSSVSNFSKEAVAAGVAGEESTAYLLETFLRGMPGVTIFHGLQFPGSERADVDHAVVIGRKVFLIDSKQFKSGEYQWYMHATHGERIGTSSQDGHKNHMDAAAKGYRTILGPDANITTLLIIHGKDMKIGPKRFSSAGVGAYTAHEALRKIGSEVRSQIPAVPNLKIKAALLSHLK